MEDIDLIHKGTCLYYGIPLCQAHTINHEKVKAYQEYLRSPIVKLEIFLDELEENRQKMDLYEDVLKPPTYFMWCEK